MMHNQHEQAGQAPTTVDEARVPARKPWQAPALSELSVNETQGGGYGSTDGGIFT